ncbi:MULTISPECIES: hypothetical protein [Cytobacillus]|uniref:hypothetical protein n=1 Tax=Cytobacillus TaxID=2675230 RepID=UPI00203F5AF1|nr:MULTISPECIES: hypothetical protein [Cytobacillus]MCM3394868.1 hypothetical protein [Cytobacillus oceanisediminis]UQX56050.1 hypothetical protein M5V91_10715 [Cytobacillus pseudoceanisediminis]
MSVFKTIFTLACIICPSLYFGFTGKPAEMGISIIMGGFVGVFLNLDKFEQFSGAGFEAKMKNEVQEAVNEAYATLDSLREISKTLFHTTLSNLTFGDRMAGMDDYEKHKHKDRILELMNDLQIEDEAISKTLETFYKLHSFDLYNNFVNGIYQETENNEVRDEMYNKSEGIYLPDEDKIREILSSHQINLSAETKDALKDYLYYRANHQYRISDEAMKDN